MSIRKNIIKFQKPPMEVQNIPKPPLEEEYCEEEIEQNIE
jgi:hypothetical protein